MALISQGHVLIEGLPGLAKTTSIKTLAEATSLSFKRIQFTPDLLPADVVGTQIYDPRTAEFLVKKGPIFANLILADEINRAPAKVQSALLEAMEEEQVTIGDKTWILDKPFLVMATQNPVEQEGTYPLPEAQIDRFLFKLKISYGTPDDEEEIIRRAQLQKRENITIHQVASKESLRSMRALLDEIYVSDKIRKYCVQIVFATRDPKKFRMSDLAPLIEYGASPRASLALDKVARVNAMMEGRHFVTPQDVKDVGIDILRHRIKLTYEAEAEAISTEDVIQKIFDRVDVP
jgi:MoxR-like ATPase